MGTKNNPPPKFDCYAKAEPDEPMFVLLGRDPLASFLVGIWVAARREMGGDPEQLAEASACSDAMLRWAVSKGKADQIKEVCTALGRSSLRPAPPQRTIVDLELLDLVTAKIATILGLELSNVRAIYYPHIATVKVQLKGLLGKAIADNELSRAVLAATGLLPGGVYLDVETPRYL